MPDPTFLAASTSPCSFHSFHQQSTISPPLSPLVSPFTTTGTTILPPTGGISSSALSLAPPPSPAPLPWIWQCHVCKARWPLGATRRCLIDGHYYCSGQPQTRKGKGKAKGRKGRSCSSEFDYIGWKDWGRWRITTKGKDLRGCEGSCEYPSHCRYRKAGVGGPKAAIEADEVAEGAGISKAGEEQEARTKLKTLEEILKEAEKERMPDDETEKERGGKGKRKKKRFALGTDTAESSSGLNTKEKVMDESQDSIRSQSMSLMMPSSDRLHKLKEATERRIERSKSMNAESFHGQEQKAKATGKERSSDVAATDSGLQPFLLPVIEFLSRRVHSGGQEDRATCREP